MIDAPKPNLRALGSTLAFSGVVGGLIFWAMMHFDLRERIDPTPARVSASMVQGAWLNVVPQEDARVALSMGQCMRVGGKVETDTQVMQRALQCEWIAKLSPGNQALAQRAIDRRQTLTRGLWGDDAAVDLKLVLLSTTDVARMWQALAEGKGEARVAGFLESCLKDMRPLGALRHENVWQRATLCEYRADWLKTYLGVEATDKLLAKRAAATAPSWPANPFVNLPPSDREHTPTWEIAKLLDRKNAQFLRSEAIAAWQSTVEQSEKNAAERLTDCLMDFEGKIATGVQICEQRGMAADASKAMDNTIERRVRHMPTIAGPGPRSQEPAPPATTPVVAQASATPPSAPLTGRQQVIKAWNDTQDPDERSAAGRLTVCLGSFQGDLANAVMICELKGMSADSSPAMDRTIARRAAATPDIKGPGPRFDPNASIAKIERPAPTREPSASTANKPPAQTSTLAIDVAGAQEIVAQWHEQAGPDGKDMVNRMTDCLRSTPVIVADARGLEMAADTCKLRVQVEIENQAKALEKLR